MTVSKNLIAEYTFGETHTRFYDTSGIDKIAGYHDGPIYGRVYDVDGVEVNSLNLGLVFDHTTDL
jgi:hypothetical protein